MAGRRKKGEGGRGEEGGRRKGGQIGKQTAECPLHSCGCSQRMDPNERPANRHQSTGCESGHTFMARKRSQAGGAQTRTYIGRASTITGW
eukprot:136428-Chlamydomonas_euryale.AAC.1